MHTPTQMMMEAELDYFNYDRTLVDIWKSRHECHFGGGGEASGVLDYPREAPVVDVGL